MEQYVQNLVYIDEDFLFELKEVYTLKTLERELEWIKQTQKQQWKN